MADCCTAGCASLSCLCIRLPFPFYFYGEPYSVVYLANSGNLQFGNNSQDGEYLESADYLPTYNAYQWLPVFEPFFAGFDLVGNGNVSWSLETVAAGQRALVIRYSNISYNAFLYSDEYYGYNDELSMDVLLYETPMGQIDVRYYRIDVDQLGETYFQIGMQSDEGFENSADSYSSTGYYGIYLLTESYFVLYDQLPIDSNAQAVLQNSVISFTFTGIEDTNDTCGGLGYDFHNISQSDLWYWDAGNSTVIYLRVCGWVSQPNCSLVLAAQGYRGSMVCQANSDENGQVAGGIFQLSRYNPNAFYWQYLPNGVRGTIQDGQYCQPTFQPRVTVLNFLCDPTALQANITQYYEDPTCTYNIDISTNIACGNGSRLNPQGAVPSTLTSCTNITGVGYTATWCPRSLTNAAAITPQVLPNLVVDINLAGYDSSMYDTVSIGFNVNLYGTNYSQMVIDENGVLTFGPMPTAAYDPAPFPDLGFDDPTDFFPLIAPLWVQTANTAYQSYPSVYDGFIGYSLEGSAPNRQFFVRFSNVDYYVGHESAVPGTCTFDVVLSENSSAIETRYYYIAPNPLSQSTIVVGMHGQNVSVYTAVQNAPLLSVDVAARLSYSSIVYSYTGPSEASVCGAGLYPQLASVADLQLSSGTSRYWLKPCGVLATSPCLSSSLATQAASVCLSSAGSVSSLATDNPTATQWVVTNASSVRSITQDGTWSAKCKAPATVIVDYVCDETSTAAELSSASVASNSCTYSLVVTTSLLCSSGQSSSSSSTAASSASVVISSAAAASSASVVASSTAAASSAVSSSLSSSASSSSVFTSSSSSLSSSSSSSASSSAVAPVQSTGATSSSSSSSTASSTLPSLASSSSITTATAVPPVQSSSATTALSSSSSSSSSSAVAAGGGAVSNSGGGGSGLSGGAIAGIVIGSVAGVALLCLLLVFLVVRGGKRGYSDAERGKSSDLSEYPSTNNDLEGNCSVELA